MESRVIGFDDPVDVQKEFRNGSSTSKQSTSSKKSGGFQSMGLSFPILKGIQKRGYKVPTPIQRKTIPLILEGRDIVAMARTGSGKTACFLVPLLEKLKSRTGKSGARGLIMSPTRELALQTLKFFKELGRFTDLQAAAILGGDSMDNQFSTIHGNPDVIVATPGRFLHICVEMELKLNSIEYIVFDEADRLFEMGFGEQLREIVNRLAESRQTVLFSATLPKVLVEFAKAGLTNPILIRLDVESKLPDELKLVFLCCRPEEKEAALLSMLHTIIKQGSQTVIFAATSHHVEYLHKILDVAGISNTYIYSNLDPSARKINAAKFQMIKVSTLIVTDVAARGIDIPQLDNVINYNFPATSKLFVHRVGRCARAGRSGTAYSLLSNEEYPYLLDLHLFLSRPLNLDPESKTDGIIGRIPQDICDEAYYQLLVWHNSHTDLANMKKVCSNAYRKYIRSRPGASVESVRRMKELTFDNVAVHPVFTSESTTSNLELNKNEFLSEMKKYRPKGNIFEIGQTSKSVVYNIMKDTRKRNLIPITKHKMKHEDKEHTTKFEKRKINLVSSTEDDIASTFQNVLEPRKKKQKSSIDKEHYIPYTSSDHHTEQGLSINRFHQEADKTTFDLTGDSEDMFKMQRKLMRWDRKKKKMVGVADVKMGKIRTESGVWIPATYKGNRYSQWKDKTKMATNDDVSDEEEGTSNRMTLKQPNTHWGRHNMKIQLKGKSELKHTDQIMKARLITERNKQKNKKKKGKKKSKKNKKK